MTGQSLYYMGEADLQHKILAIAEEEGASNASYALKLLQSEGELTIASTGKNPTDGRLITQDYRVTGPVMVMTTTAIELDEELMNRCVVLTVDDGREQTRAIHEKQREAQTIEGRRAARRDPRKTDL
jgi:DNA primase